MIVDKKTSHPVKYFAVILKRDKYIQLGGKFGIVLKKDLANAVQMNFCLFINFYCTTLQR